MFFSYFDESGTIICQGLINDITKPTGDEFTNPVDFLINGFKNSKKLALLIEPLNANQFNFSKRFYKFIERDPNKYYHSMNILNNIAENDTFERINALIDGKLDGIDETFTNYLMEIRQQEVC